MEHIEATVTSPIKKIVITREDGERIRVPIPDPKWRWVSGFIWFSILAILFGKVPVPWPYTEAEDGDSVLVVDYYSSVAGLVLAGRPKWQSRTYEDGTLAKGPLDKGHRHGLWIIDREGAESALHYNWGVVAGEKAPQ